MDRDRSPPPDKDPDVEKPVEIDKPLPSQVMAGVRTLLMMGGAYFVREGVVTDEQLVTVVAAAIAIGTFVWSQWVTRNKAQKAVIAANAAPDSKAVVKGE